MILKDNRIVHFQPDPLDDAAAKARFSYWYFNCFLVVEGKEVRFDKIKEECAGVMAQHFDVKITPFI